MKNKLDSLKDSKRYATFLRWGKMLSVTGFAQVLVQLAGVATGLIVTNLLPKQEYAYYTIAITMLGTMTVLADSGIGVGVMSSGGKVWDDKFKLGEVLKTGVVLRRKFAIFSLVVSLPILVFLLHKQGAETLTIFLICASLLPAFWAALSDSLLETIPKLHHAVLPLQKNQGFVSFGRLALTSLSVFLFPFTFVTLLANGVPRIWGNAQLKKISTSYVDETAGVNETVKRDILNIVKRSLPGNIYYCISGQLTLWLLSFFGTSSDIAGIGAMTRITMLTSIVSMMFNTLFIPQFSKLTDKSKMIKHLGLYFSFLIAICLVIIFFTWLLDDFILSLLGNSYLGLNFELLLTMTLSCLTLIGGACYGLSSSQGWIINPVLLITTNIFSVVVGLYFFKVDNITDALYFQLTTALIPLVITISFLLIKVARYRQVAAV